RQALAAVPVVTGAGCLATATILGLYPLARAGLLSPNLPLVIEAKVGSSAAGNTPSLASHHPERQGAVRSFEPTGHRHTAEVLQELSGTVPLTVHFSARTRRPATPMWSWSTAMISRLVRISRVSSFIAATSLPAISGAAMIAHRLNWPRYSVVLMPPLPISSMSGSFQ